MWVKIVSGTYGYRNKNGILTPKDRTSLPFELDEEEAVRLLALGVAEAWTQTENATENGAVDDAPAEIPLSEQIRDWSKKELVKLAEDMGLASYGTKDELIERITNKIEEEGETEEETGEGEKLPPLTPAEPEI